MVLLVSNFLMNVFCGFARCDPSYPLPSDPLRAVNGNADLFGQTQLSANPIVHTKDGALEGYMMKTILNRNIYAFEGIPYSEYEPGGHNRFKPSKAKSPWTGVRDAKRVGERCLQINPYQLFKTLGSEDCLYLNIYTTQLPEQNDITYSRKLPVVVYIHGGSYAFFAGSQFGPAYLLDEDVILITMNYRLGVLGFLSVGDDESPGNNGLRDQELALKWAYENVEVFGGDRNKITLLGHSAGGASVHFHMLANRTRSYFRNAISLSGSAFHQWALKDPNKNRVLNQKLSKNTGCPLSSSKVFVNCLRNMNAYDLVRRQQFLYEWLNFPPVQFAPVVEHQHVDAVITETPEETYRKKTVYNIPWISTMTADEGQYSIIALRGAAISTQLTKYWRTRAPIFLDYNWASAYLDVDNITSEITKFYLKEKSMDPSSADVTLFGEMTSDRYFFPGTRKSLQMHCQVAPTYAGLFDFHGKHGFSDFFLLDPAKWGKYTAHGDDIFYIFNSSTLVPGWQTTDKEFQITKLLCNFIANFADKGEPTLLTLNHGSGEPVKIKTEKTIWEPIDNPSALKYLQIDEGLEMVSQPHSENLRFWETLGLSDVQSFHSH